MFKNNSYKCIIMSILTLISFFINSQLIYEDIKSVKNPFTIDYFTIAIIFFLFYFFYKKKSENKLDIYQKILANLFSIFMVFGKKQNLVQDYMIYMIYLLLK